MTYSGAWDRLTTVEKVEVLYLVFIVVFVAYSAVRSGSAPRDQTDRELQYQHLERGGEIRIPRWHGGTLVLSGDLEVDADHLPADDQEEPIE